MPSNPLKTGIGRVRKRLDKVREAMLTASSEAIEQSVPELEASAEELTRISHAVAAQPLTSPAERHELVRSLREIQVELARLAALSAGGLEFCRRWSETLQSAAGYLATGEAAPIASSNTTIALEG